MSGPLQPSWIKKIELELKLDEKKGSQKVNEKEERHLRNSTEN